MSTNEEVIREAERLCLDHEYILSKGEPWELCKAMAGTMGQLVRALREADLVPSDASPCRVCGGRGFIRRETT